MDGAILLLTQLKFINNLSLFLFPLSQMFSFGLLC